MEEIKPELVEAWLREAGALALQFAARPDMTAEHKADNSLVTEADLAVERLLVARIQDTYSGHAIIGEEATRQSGSEYAWVIDPIDGTSAFFLGAPTWCVSLGVLRDGQPHLGMVYVPYTDELFISRDGQTSRNGHLLSVSSATKLNRDTLFCVSTLAHQLYPMKGFPGRLYSFGSCVYQNCLVARGAVCGTLSRSPRLWDLAGALPLVRGAGGDMVYLSGEPVVLADLMDGSPVHQPVLSAPPQLIELLLAIIRRSAVAGNGGG